MSDVLATRRHREIVIRALCPRSAPLHTETWLQLGGKPSGSPCWRVYNKLAQALADIEEQAFAGLLRNACGSEHIGRLIACTREGKCANCGGDGFNIGYNGPEPCHPCGATGHLSAPMTVKR